MKRSKKAVVTRSKAKVATKAKVTKKQAKPASKPAVTSKTAKRTSKPVMIKVARPTDTPIGALRALTEGAADAKVVATFIANAQPALPVNELVSLAAFGKMADDVRRPLVAAVLARPDECAAIAFGRTHAAALTNDLSLLAGAADDELAVSPRVAYLLRPLALAAQRGHLDVARALIARGAKLDDDDRPLDVAVSYGHDAVAELLLEQGARPTFRTVNKLSHQTSERLLDRLVAAGLDLNDPDSDLAGRIGALTDPTTAERVAFARRLIARGFRLDGARLLQLLEDVHWETLAEADFGAAMIDFAHAEGVEPDEALVAFALDRLPVAALDALARAGATFRPGTRVKSTAPDAAKKKAWLARHGGATSAASAPISWKDFARLDGADLTTPMICERLVGDAGVFPDLDVESFEGEIEDEDLPATHTLEVGETAIEYFFSCFMHGRTFDDTYKKRSKATFDALAKAITAVHGKPATNRAQEKTWELADRQLDLYLSSTESNGESNYARPSSQVSLRSSRS